MPRHEYKLIRVELDNACVLAAQNPTGVQPQDKNIHETRRNVHHK